MCVVYRFDVDALLSISLFLSGSVANVLPTGRWVLLSETGITEIDADVGEGLGVSFLRHRICAVGILHTS